MPAKIVIDTAHAATAYEPARDHLRTIYTKHHKALTRIVLERRNRGPASGRISQAIACERDPGETVDGYVDSLIDRTIELIQADSVKPRGRNTPNANSVGAWSGRVVLIDEKRPKKEQELDSMLVDIEDPDAFQSFESEYLGFAREMRTTVKTFGDTMNSMARAFTRREKAVTKMVVGVAKASGKVHRSSGRWAWKATKEQEQTKREQTREEKKTERSAKRHDAFEAIVTEFKDEVSAWSAYWRDQIQQGGGLVPKKPTDEEVKKVFDANEEEAKRYDVEVQVDGSTYTCRKVVAEMLAEKDKRRRIRLAKILREVMKQYPQDTIQVLGARLQMTFGEARAKEIIRWLKTPTSW